MIGRLIQWMHTRKSGKVPKLHDMEVDDYLYDCVTVMPEALQEEFVRVSGDLSYWSRRYSLAHRAKLLAEVRRKQVIAEQYFAIKERLIKETGKGTAKDVEYAIELDERVQESKAAEIEADFEKEQIKGTLDAIRSKRDMLVSVGAQIRAEMAQDPFIKKNG